MCQSGACSTISGSRQTGSWRRHRGALQSFTLNPQFSASQCLLVPSLQNSSFYAGVEEVELRAQRGESTPPQCRPEHSGVRAATTATPAHTTKQSPWPPPPQPPPRRSRSTPLKPPPPLPPSDCARWPHPAAMCHLSVALLRAAAARRTHAHAPAHRHHRRRALGGLQLQLEGTRRGLRGADAVRLVLLLPLVAAAHLNNAQSTKHSCRSTVAS